MHNTIIIFLLILLFPIFANAAVCDAGYYLDENGRCTVCWHNHYCIGDDIMRDCPVITYSANDIKDLLRNNGYDATSFSAFELQSGWFFTQDTLTNIEKCILRVSGIKVVQGEIDTLGFFYSTLANNYVRKRSGTYWKSANTGYYLTGVHASGTLWYNVKPCTNPYPDFSHYSGPGTPDSADGTIVDANDCPWECDAGYGRTKNDTCEPLCDAGITKLNTSNGLSYNIYAERHTTPSINLLRNNMVCYINLESGSATNAINIQHGNTVYHVTD